MCLCTCTHNKTMRCRKPTSHETTPASSQFRRSHFHDTRINIKSNSPRANFHVKNSHHQSRTYACRSHFSQTVFSDGSLCVIMAKGRKRGPSGPKTKSTTGTDQAIGTKMSLSKRFLHHRATHNRCIRWHRTRRKMSLSKPRSRKPSGTMQCKTTRRRNQFILQIQLVRLRVQRK
jgi:hypothetical protein